MNYENLLTEWGVNGLSNQGKRFIGLASFPDKKYSLKDKLVEKVIERNKRLWSDNELYLENSKDS